MAKFQWNEITKEDVIKAICEFECENPTYPEPKSTFLIYDGKKYPAKHIRLLLNTMKGSIFLKHVGFHCYLIRKLL